MRQEPKPSSRQEKPKGTSSDGTGPPGHLTICNLEDLDKFNLESQIFSGQGVVGIKRHF